MRRGIPVIAVGAVDEQAICRRGPVHLEDLRGAVTMTYEPDMGWILSPEDLGPAGDGAKARTVRLAIEKNRHGPSEAEWTHHLYGERSHLRRKGPRVAWNESFQRGDWATRALSETNGRCGRRRP